MTISKMYGTAVKFFYLNFYVSEFILWGDKVSTRLLRNNKISSFNKVRSYHT